MWDTLCVYRCVCVCAYKARLRAPYTYSTSSSLVSLPFSRFKGLQEVWDTLGVCGVASMPPATQGYSCSSTPGMSALRGRGWPHKGRLVLAPEASTALSLVADLASSHVCVYVYVCVHWGRGVLCVYMCTCGVCVRACVYASQE